MSEAPEFVTDGFLRIIVLAAPYPAKDVSKAIEKITANVFPRRLIRTGRGWGSWAIIFPVSSKGPGVTGHPCFLFVPRTDGSPKRLSPHDIALRKSRAK